MKAGQDDGEGQDVPDVDLAVDGSVENDPDQDGHDHVLDQPRQVQAVPLNHPENNDGSQIIWLKYFLFVCPRASPHFPFPQLLPLLEIRLDVIQCLSALEQGDHGDGKMGRRQEIPPKVLLPGEKERRKRTETLLSPWTHEQQQLQST